MSEPVITLCVHINSMVNILDDFCTTHLFIFRMCTIGVEDHASVNHLLGPEVLDNVVPQLGVLGQLDEVSDAEESVFSARQSHAHPVICPEEANAALYVASDEREEDDVIFLALVVIHRGYSHSLKLLLWHVVLENEQLTGVSCQNRDLLWLITLLEEVSAQLNQECCLVKIALGVAILNSSFLLRVINEEHI